MNDILPTPINEKRVAKILSIVLLFFCLLPTVLNITCLTPIYFNLENNTLYRGTAITLTLKYISDLLDLISFSSVYAIIIFSLTLLKKRATVLVSIAYSVFLLLKIPARLLLNIPLYGTIGAPTEILADLISLSFYFILEILQFILVLLFASIVTNNYLRSVEFINNKNAKNKKNSKAPKTKIEHILPIKKFVNWYNPLLRASFFASITITAFKFLARIITDIDAGAPTSFGEVMIMIVNYLTDAVYGLVAYVIAILIFNLLFEKLTKETSSNKKSNNKNNKNSKKENKADEETSSALFED